MRTRCITRRELEIGTADGGDLTSLNEHALHGIRGRIATGARDLPMSDRTTITPPQERQLLSDIGALSDRLRKLRSSGNLDPAQIRAVEAQSRVKWEELRAMRAGPATGELTRPDPRGHYR